MADDPHQAGDVSDPIKVAKEDAETTAARRELKQTSISERGGATGMGTSLDDKSGSEDEAVTKEGHTAAPSDNSTDRISTPEIDAAAAARGDLREQVSSPKKKRAHDELDEQREDGDGSDGWVVVDKSVVSSRTDRLEPEKKRPRDHQEGDSPAKTLKNKADESAATSNDEVTSKAAGENSDTTAKTEKDARETVGKQAQTSSSAFAKSGFAKLAGASTSGFGSLGASTTSSPFGGLSSSSPSSFASMSTPKATAPGAAAPAKLTFGSGAPAPSPFAAAGLNGTAKSGFGSALGGQSVFGTSLGGPRLSSFASSKAADVAKTDKPARPFGAPDSDAEEGGDDEADEAEEEDQEAASKTEEDQDKAKEEAKSSNEDSKKPKLQRIVVDDGESDEATVLAVRAKMYQLDKELGWKERGAGMLKLNVPNASVEFDETGTADVTSFDASVLEYSGPADAEAKSQQSVRLIMRQDHTHRLILNTTIVPAIKFQMFPKLKSATVLFTAFDTDEVKQVQMKMSEANANLFMEEIGLIQKRLADV